jgi:hypothetical protein
MELQYEQLISANVTHQNLEKFIWAGSGSEFYHYLWTLQFQCIATVSVTSSKAQNTGSNRLFGHDRGRVTHLWQRKTYSSRNIHEKLHIFRVVLHHLTHLLYFTSASDSKESSSFVLFRLASWLQSRIRYLPWVLLAFFVSGIEGPCLRISQKNIRFIWKNGPCKG